LVYALLSTFTFYSLHIGHKKILGQLNHVAQRANGESVLLTFYPHPRLVLQPDIDLKLINSQQEKIEHLKQTGLDHLIIHPFTREFSRTKSLDFVRDILVNTIGAKKLVIGYDHHFGRNREGSFEHLKEYGPLYGFDVEEIPAQDLNDVTVSSTKIRKALAHGDLKKANKYLDYEYTLSGSVTSGEQMGKKLGFPTANILVEEPHKLIPKDGLYAVEVDFPASPEVKHQGVCNIGMRPTFAGKFKTIETHILDFDRNIYGEQIKITFKHYLREERKFNDTEDLVAQMHKDIDQARAKLTSS